MPVDLMFFDQKMWNPIVCHDTQNNDSEHKDPQYNNIYLNKKEKQRNIMLGGILFSDIT